MRAPVALLALVACAAALGSCSDKETTLVTLEILVPDGEDPLEDATSLRISLGGDLLEEVDRPSSGDWSDLEHDISLGAAAMDPTPILLEGLSDSGDLVCIGESVPVLLYVGVTGRARVFVQRPGTSGLAPDASEGRSRHAAAYLEGGGVLLVGGGQGGATSVSSAEVYDLASYEPVEVSAMPSGRSEASAALFGSGGDVVIVGGRESHDDVLVYDPGDDAYESLDLPDEARGEWPSPPLAPLESGDVIAVRGEHVLHLEAGGSPSASVLAHLPADVSAGTVTAVSSSRAIVVGDGAVTAIGLELGSGDTFDVPDPPGGARTGHCAAALSDGRLVLAGGEAEEGLIEQVVVLASDGERWTLLEGMLEGEGRVGATLSALEDDRLVLVGGLDADGLPVGDAIVLDVDRETAERLELADPRGWHAAVLAPNGTVIIAGGESSEGRSLRSVEVLRPPLGAE